MKLRSSWPVLASTMRSIRGRGKLSLGHARLTSVKSMHRRHLPFAFLTSTTLAYCDALFPRVPLTTRQPVKYSWTSGSPDTTHENRAKYPLYGELYPRYKTCLNNLQ